MVVRMEDIHREKIGAAGLAMVLTGAGAAGIAVVRLVGVGVEGFLKAHFTRRANAGRCVHGELVEGGRVIDDPVVVMGEEGRWCDVNVHGGPWVVASVLELARRAGFEVVDRSEMPARLEAVDGENILQREVLAYLPMARTELGVRMLLGQEDAWAKADAELDVQEVLRDRPLWWLLHPPTVAIVGAANVGKSTLANQLFAQERSITADMPGTTRDWVGEMANLDGLAVMLVDTPGVRATEDAIEREAIERSGEEVRRADLVVVVLDASRMEEKEQEEIVGRYPGAVLVLNKVDRAGVGVGMEGAVRTVATTGEGVNELRAAIRGHVGCEGMEMGRARWWTGRQREVLERGGRGVGRIVVEGA